jgi:hypothetical protein
MGDDRRFNGRRRVGRRHICIGQSGSGCRFNGAHWRWHISNGWRRRNPARFDPPRGRQDGSRGLRERAEMRLQVVGRGVKISRQTIALVAIVRCRLVNSIFGPAHGASLQERCSKRA